jgi:hypothetical protein
MYAPTMPSRDTVVIVCLVGEFLVIAMDCLRGIYRGMIGDIRSCQFPWVPRC